MLIDAIEIQGMKSVRDWSQRGLGVRVDMPSPPTGVAIADAISLVESVLSPDRFAPVCASLGLSTPAQELHNDEAGFIEQAVELDRDGVESLLDNDGNRRITVSMTLSLDPPLFGRLREESMRDPRVMTALGQNATLSLKVGWLFSMDRSAVSLGVLEVLVGDTPFPLNKSERPGWMNGMLRAIGGRLGRIDWGESVVDVSQRLQLAALSADPARRSAYARAAAVLAKPPFDLGHLELIGFGGSVRAAFGPDLVRARQLGPGAARALRLVEAAILRAPDVLVVEDATPAESEWLVSCTEGDHATLEQLWILGNEA